MSRLGAASYLTLAAPLCILGAVMTWVSASTLRDAYRTRDWVKIRAEVTWAELARSSRPQGGYHYELGGQEYEGNRLGFANVALGIVDEWPADMYAYLSLARSEKRPIMVWMNPDNPQDAVVDRELHGGTVLLLLPFTLLCYAAAFLALRAAWRVGSDAPEREPRKVDAGMLNAFQYVALGWNSLTWLVALEMDLSVGPGRWGGLGILLPIAIGMVLLWKMIGMLRDNWDEYSIYEED
jgi:uncharacterized protein DUF3592